MVQDKETQTFIDRHEGEISGEIIVYDTTDFIGEGKAPKQNTFVIDSLSGMMLTPSILVLYSGPGYGRGSSLYSGKSGGATWGVLVQVLVVQCHPLFWLSCLCFISLFSDVSCAPWPLQGLDFVRLASIAVGDHWSF